MRSLPTSEPGRGPVRVTLNEHEMLLASNIACSRRAHNLANGVQPKFGAPTKLGSWEIDIFACHCELATAKYLGLLWTGTLNDFRARDVGGLVDVRWRSKEHYQLILHKEDPPEVPFVVAFGFGPTYELRGWLFAHEGQKDQFWSDPAQGRPAYFVPDTELAPMPDLQKWVVESGLPKLYKRREKTNESRRR